MADQVFLRDGTEAWVWPLLPTDRAGLVREFEELSPESRRRRFLAPVMTLSEQMLQHLVDDVDGIDHVALVLAVDTGDAFEPVAIGRMVRYQDLPDAADLAVTVKDSWQGRGVATALLQVLVAHRPAGVRRVITEVAGGNPASLAMLEHLGTVYTHDGGSAQLDIEVHLDAVEPLPEIPVAQPSGRLHHVLEDESRHHLRIRDRVCPWFADR